MMDEPGTAIDLLLAIFVLSGLIISGISIPMILMRIKPNPFYGFRTPKTLGDIKIWYKANAYSGRLFFAFGIVFATTAIILRFLPVIGSSVLYYSIACTTVSVAGLIFALVSSFRFLKSL